MSRVRLAFLKINAQLTRTSKILTTVNLIDVSETHLVPEYISRAKDPLSLLRELVLENDGLWND